MPKKHLALFFAIFFISTLAFASSATILEGSINYTSRTMEIDIAYPVLIDGTNKKAIQKINNTIKRDIDNFYNYFLEYRKHYIPKGRPGFQGNVSYVIEMNEKDLLSLSITYYEYTGGAHGISEQIGYTFELSSGNRLFLKDLFKTDYPYNDILKEQVVQEIDQNSSDYFQDAKDHVLENDFSFGSFYLKPNNLVVYFGVYDIAPYYLGSPEFIIPKEILSEGLIIDF